MDVVVLDGGRVRCGRLPWAVAERFPDLRWYDETPSELTAERIGGAEAVFVDRVRLDEAVFARCPNLKYVGIFATGCDKIDLSAASRRGITVCNVPGYSAHAVAQHTAALLLAVTNRIPEFSDGVKAGKWDSPTAKLVTGTSMTELSGKTVGIYGCGSIGTAFGEICRAMGMKVLGYRRNPSGEEPFPMVERDRLLEESDVLSLHCPLTSETKGMVDQGFLSRMKWGAILLNTARGGLLDEAAVAEALDTGQLSWAAVDVLSAEPPERANPLLNHPKCLVTPHVAWCPKETRQRLLQIAGENFFCFLEGDPQNQVN